MRLGCSINLLLTQLPSRAAAEMEEEVDQENRKLFGKRVYLQSPRLILPVGSVCLPSPRPAGEAGVPFANCDFPPSAALPGVTGQTKSPTPT